MAAFAALGDAQALRPEIPRVWDGEEAERFEVPLALRERSPRYMTSREYSALKVRPICRTCPVYAPGREPAGYIESLKQKEPGIIFDPSQIVRYPTNNWTGQPPADARGSATVARYSATLLSRDRERTWP
jgi:hypothetical protein